MTTCYFCREEIAKEEIVAVVTEHDTIQPMHKKCKDIIAPEIHDARGDETKIVMNVARLWVNGGGDPDGFLYLIGDIYDAIRDLECKIEYMKER